MFTLNMHRIIGCQSKDEQRDLSAKTTAVRRMNRKTPSFHTKSSKALVTFLVVLACASGVLLARNRNENQIALSQPLTIRWRYDSDQTSNLTPAADANLIYVPLAGGVLVSLSVADGKLSWKAETGGEFSAAPVVDERSVFAAGQFAEPDGHAQGTLQALTKPTGVTTWMRTLSATLKGSFVANDHALFAGSVDGRVYAFDKRTGLTLWITQFAEGFSSQPALSNEVAYFGGDNGLLMALDQKTGQLSWYYRSHGPIRGPIVLNGGVIYFGSSDGYVYALSELQHKLLWRWRTGAAVQSVAVVDGGLLAASLDNFAYLLSRSKGSLIWRRLLPGRIASQPVTAPDGALFTPLSSDRAIVLNLRDGKPANALALGEENSSSAAPVAANDLVLITTTHGLLAFARPQQKAPVAAPNH